MASISCRCGEVIHYAPEHAGNGVRCRCGNIVSLPGVSVMDSSPRGVTESPLRERVGTDRSVRSAFAPYILATLILLVLVIVGLNRWRAPTYVATSTLSHSATPASSTPDLPTPSQAATTSNDTALVRRATERLRILQSREAAASDRPSDACSATDSSADFRAASNGFEPYGDPATGRGSLKVSNGSDADALVSLVPTGTEDVARAMFVRRGRAATLRDVAPGEYTLVFAKGSTFLSVSAAFCHDDGEFEFDKTVQFSETATGYSDFAATLYAVPNGNTKFHRTAHRVRRRGTAPSHDNNAS